MISQPNPIFSKAPTKRTFTKAGREAAITALAGSAAYTVAHAADLGLSPEFLIAVGPLANFAYRYIRGLLGAEPVE